jgi:multicomponent Na+:H+ antiporter subunit D
MNPALPAVLVLPLAGALVAWLAGARRARFLGVATAGATVAAALALAGEVAARGPYRVPLGGWPAPLGIELAPDGLGALMILVTSVVALAISVFAFGYLDEGRARAFWPLWLFLWAALHALLLSADVFNLYVALELMSLAAVALIAAGGERGATAAATRYLLAAMLASLVYLLGVAVLYGAYGTLDLGRLAGIVTPTPSSTAALALLMAGLLLKTALFPLHFWLPRAHASAPAPVSAALSGLVVAASFVVALRIWFVGLAGAASPMAARFIGILAALAIVWGSIQALRQRGLKLLVGYSTVAQVGYFFLVFPLATAPGPEGIAWSEEAWIGGVYHAVSHAVAKAAMFLAVGVIALQRGSDRIGRARGAAERMPLATFAFGLGGITLIGLPPSGGFVAKWYLLTAALGSGRWIWAAVVLTGGILASFYVFRVLLHAFTPADDLPPERPEPLLLSLTALALAVVSLVMGLRAVEILALLRLTPPWTAGGG